MRKLPPNVYRDRSRYAYKPYLGRVEGKRRYGKPIRLCGLDSPLSEVWKAYERVTVKEYDTLRWLLQEYNKSDQFKKLAKATQTGYEGYQGVICRKKTKGGEFGDAGLRQITKRTIRKYLDAYQYPIVANRHIQYIKAAWNWGLERYENIPSPNPCMGVRLNKEVARDRYITDQEYDIVYQAALSQRVPYVAYAMELAYLCRARRSEVYGLTWADIREDGIFLNRHKGSRGEITQWTQRLRAAVEGCKTIYSKAPVPITGGFLLHDRNGKPFAKNALDSAWQRVIRKAKTKGLKESFTYHDIKAKGCTDSDAENAGLHKSKKMQAVYDRLPKIVTLDYGE